MSYTEVRNLPIQYRRWFIRRLVKQSEQQSAYVKTSTRGKDNDSTPESSSDMGKVEKFFAKFDS